MSTSGVRWDNFSAVQTMDYRSPMLGLHHSRHQLLIYRINGGASVAWTLAPTEHFGSVRGLPPATRLKMPSTVLVFTSPSMMVRHGFSYSPTLQPWLRALSISISSMTSPAIPPIQIVSPLSLAMASVCAELYSPWMVAQISIGTLLISASTQALSDTSGNGTATAFVRSLVASVIMAPSVTITA